MPPLPTPQMVCSLGASLLRLLPDTTQFSRDFSRSVFPTIFTILSLELARLTGCKFRMDVLSLVRYRRYDHDIL